MNNKQSDDLYIEPKRIVCEVCSVCFHPEDRAPIILCSFNHSACRICADEFGEKGISKCPFCRNDLSLSDMTQN